MRPRTGEPRAMQDLAIVMPKATTATASTTRTSWTPTSGTVSSSCVDQAVVEPELMRRGESKAVGR